MWGARAKVVGVRDAGDHSFNNLLSIYSVTADGLADDLLGDIPLLIGMGFDCSLGRGSLSLHIICTLP